MENKLGVEQVSTYSASCLKTAREWRGMTRRQLAITLGKSEKTVTVYEQGREPLNEDIHAIAQILEFPVDFFYSSEIEDIGDDDVTFRARRRMTNSVKSAADARCKIARSRLTPTFKTSFNLPEPNLPELDIDIKAEGAAEDAARQLRSYWKLGFGPIGNLVHLLEAQGIRVYWINDDSPSVFAFSFWHNKEPYIFLSTPNNSGERARFSAAHELCHLILHQNAARLDAHEIEAQADEFASAFLMPKEQFLAECPRTPILDNLLRMKRRWGTSAAAMVVRGYKAGHWTQWYYENAFKEISGRGWRKAEPLQLEREQSFIHDYIYSNLAEKGTTATDLAATLSVGVDIILELTPAAKQYTNRRLRHLQLVSD